jgi:hypothetical protein
MAVQRVPAGVLTAGLRALIAGTVANSGGQRDTDWYQITLSAPSSVVHWAVSAQFGALAASSTAAKRESLLLEISGYFRPTWQTSAFNDCTRWSSPTRFPAGTWWFVVTTYSFGPESLRVQLRALPPP